MAKPVLKESKLPTGKWITMHGRHVWLEDGQTVEQALAKDAKKFAKEEEDRREKEIAEREKNTEKLTAEKNANEALTYTKDGVTYSIERSKGGVYLNSKAGNKLTKSKISNAGDLNKASVKLTGKGVVYLKKDPNMLKLLKNS